MKIVHRSALTGTNPTGPRKPWLDERIALLSPVEASQCGSKPTSDSNWFAAAAEGNMQPGVPKGVSSAPDPFWNPVTPRICSAGPKGCRPEPLQTPENMNGSSGDGSVSKGVRCETGKNQ